MLAHWTAPRLLDPVRFFEEFDRAAGFGTSWTPKFEVKYEDRGIAITADIPGVKPEDLDISVEGYVLTIKGSRAGRGAFKKTYELPESTDVDSLSAHIEHGVLTLVLPKLPKAQPKKIPITSSATQS